MQLAYIFGLLFIVPYFCSGGLLDSLGEKNKKKKDTCPTYTCLLSLTNECRTEFAKKQPPIKVSDNVLCEVFDELLSIDNDDDFTPEVQQQMMDKYLPIFSCVVEKTGLATCGQDDKGQIFLNVTADLSLFTKEFGPKCFKELATGQMPIEAFNLELLGDLKTEFEKVLISCGEVNPKGTLPEINAQLRVCFGGVLKGFNVACKKPAKETFCPNIKETQA